MARTSNYRIAALNTVRQGMAEIEGLAVNVAEVDARLARLDQQRNELAEHRTALVAGLGHYAGAELAANLSTSTVAAVRKAMKSHPAKSIGDNVTAWESYKHPKRAATFPPPVVN